MTATATAEQPSPVDELQKAARIMHRYPTAFWRELATFLENCANELVRADYNLQLVPHVARGLLIARAFLPAGVAGQTGTGGES